MDWRQHLLPLDRPFLRALARWLLAHAPRGDEGDLADVLVLVPAKRAAESLMHLLLEESGRETLLLPRIMTLARLEEELAKRLGLLDRPVVNRDLRAILLGQQLPELEWLRDRSEIAPGLAEELVQLFDELRLHERTALLEGGATPPDLPGESGDPGRRELRTLHEAWRLYREIAPRDATDRRVEACTAAERDPSRLPRSSLVAVAGFVKLTPVDARLVRAVAGRAEAHLFTAAADDPLSRLLLASYSDPGSPVHPLTPQRAAAVRLADDGPGGPHVATAPGDGGTLRSRLDGLESELAAHLGRRPVQLLSCGDPEEESRVVAALVAETLAEHRERAVGRLPRIGIATADRELARRIKAQLRDAGLDCDDTGGQPLAQLPGGVLATVLLQAVAKGLHHEPLLELLTHPLVALFADRGLHARWTLRFEKMIRGEQRPRGGMASYERRAAEWDASERRLASGRDSRRGEGPASDRDEDLTTGGMSAFVARLAEALAPLTALAGRAEGWDSHATAFRRAWAGLAPGHELGRTQAPDGRPVPDDERALADLLAAIEQTARLPAVAAAPAVTLADFASAMGRLLARNDVIPRRRQLPIQLAGTLEARLEEYDLLILAGMSEDVFPGQAERPAFLADAARRALGLDGWRDDLARRSEQFLRLLHAGRETIVTWPRERRGQPCLVSPLVSRLGLSGTLPCTRWLEPPLFRREAPPWEIIRARQASFEAEPVAIPAGGRPRPVGRLSHSALKTYRDCPYRFLLERGFGLREEEEVLEEFRRQDYGTRVHACLRDWLVPDGEGDRALAGGEGTAAGRALAAIAAREFAAGAQELPQRRLWEERFLETIDGLVAFELERREAGWRPELLEAPFELTLGELAGWLSSRPAGPDDPPPPDLPAETAPLLVTGLIDRVDRHETSGARAVIDYKTGTSPTARAVREGQDLQITLYALAILAGRVEGGPGGHGKVAEGAYHQVSPGACGFRTPQLTVDGDDGEGAAILRRGARLILETALAIMDPARPFPLIPAHWTDPPAGGLPCALCPFAAICRLEERPRPPHVSVRLRRELAFPRRG